DRAARRRRARARADLGHRGADGPRVARAVRRQRRDVVRRPGRRARGDRARADARRARRRHPAARPPQPRQRGARVAVRRPVPPAARGDPGQPVRAVHGARRPQVARERPVVAGQASPRDRRGRRHRPLLPRRRQARRHPPLPARPATEVAPPVRPRAPARRPRLRRPRPRRGDGAGGGLPPLAARPPPAPAGDPPRPL
ncbi:MAG: hypothetical protein AVDCRST_MAG85-4294, partial [uncultured Solirubrobacteraceae bacterium]